MVYSKACSQPSREKSHAMPLSLEHTSQQRNSYLELKVAKKKIQVLLTNLWLEEQVDSPAGSFLTLKTSSRPGYSWPELLNSANIKCQGLPYQMEGSSTALNRSTRPKVEGDSGEDFLLVPPELLSRTHSCLCHMTLLRKSTFKILSDIYES